jgi:cell division protein FtsW (lipid II flippase)
MAIAEQSLLSFGYQLITSFDTAQVVFDLYIMAFLAICWMYRDSQLRDKSMWYFISFAVLTLVFVAIGPLLYLVLKPSDEYKKRIDRKAIES